MNADTEEIYYSAKECDALFGGLFDVADFQPEGETASLEVNNLDNNQRVTLDEGNYFDVAEGTVPMGRADEIKADVSAANDFVATSPDMIGEILVAARKSAQLTQAEVADRVGKAQSNVIRLEKGRSTPNVSTLQQYAEAIGYNLEIHLTPKV